MHIPDFLFGYGAQGIPLGILFWAVAIVFIVLSINWARKNLTESKIAILAVIAAGIFALQAFNLPTGFGVSGHLVGGALAAIVLSSPFAAVFVLTIVLIIQALIFGDGGVLALGANIINMGVIAGFTGFYTFRLLKDKIKTAPAAAIAGWLACVVAAVCASVEIALLGAVPISVGLPAMFVYHALIGIVEAIITAVIVTLIFKVRPELAGSDEKSAVPIKKIVAVGIIAALVIGGCAVFFASSNPDGLDSTILISGGAKELFAPATSEDIETADDPVGWSAPLPDYTLGDSALGAIIALVIGIFVALLLIFIAAKAVHASGRRS